MNRIRQGRIMGSTTVYDGLPYCFNLINRILNGITQFLRDFPIKHATVASYSPGVDAPSSKQLLRSTKPGDFFCEDFLGLTNEQQRDVTVSTKFCSAGFSRSQRIRLKP